MFNLIYCQLHIICINYAFVSMPLFFTTGFRLCSTITFGTLYTAMRGSCLRSFRLVQSVFRWRSLSFPLYILFNVFMSSRHCVAHTFYALFFRFHCLLSPNAVVHRSTRRMLVAANVPSTFFTWCTFQCISTVSSRVSCSND